jgi:hypothetical protein
MLKNSMLDYFLFVLSFNWCLANKNKPITKHDNMNTESIKNKTKPIIER